MHMELLEWDASTYDSLDLPHKRWGRGVLDRLRLKGDETVLELGCGSGRDTELLLAALPRGRVVAVDGSLQMLERLGEADGRLQVLHRDLREPFDLGGPFDAVMSVATFHWLPDHQHVFDELARVVRAGGRLAIDAGGHGNITAFLQAVGSVREDDNARFWNFADIPETRTRLRSAGFRENAVRLEADEVRLEDRTQLEAFVATVMLAPQLRELPNDERVPSVRSVCDRLHEPVIDYVRLQIEAIRAPARMSSEQ